jgi:hypothetical protein
MSNRTEARSAKAARMHATGRLPLLRLFSTPLIDPNTEVRGKGIILNRLRNRHRRLGPAMVPAMMFDFYVFSGT